MNFDRHKTRCLAGAIFGLLMAGAGLGQMRDWSPSQLIAFLTYQSVERRGRPMSFSCGADKVDREVAKSLAMIGGSAIPSIIRALDSIEKSGAESEYACAAGWLLLAFAKIEGPAAFPRLQQMIGKPGLSFLTEELDTAVELSLGLTSYVSASSSAIPIVRCARQGEPRDALNRLVLGWEKNERQSFESSLGPSARASLGSLLKGRSWGEVRRLFWNDKPTREIAIGYRFETTGPWSEPEETLADKDYGGPAMPENPRINVVFKDRNGADCGQRTLIFVRYPMLDPTLAARRGIEREQSLPYYVDNSDIVDLLRLIGSCASR